MLTGEINKNYDAEKEYLEKIQSDEDLLRSEERRKGRKTQRLLSFIEKVKYGVFGVLFPSQEESDKEESEISDMSELESEESAEQRRNQQGQGLKILTPKQMIIRLPILLAQLKAGNNSEKFKNEIRQLAYSLCRSKNLTKTIYNNLINII